MTEPQAMITLDGSQGEGGGQVLRSALSLALITGRPFTIEQIRARRSRPGLLRQHLTAVQAAAHFCDAELEGATPGSQRLRFVPGAVRGGEARFAIGSAGSTVLVAQTLIPALMAAGVEARVELSGGTHNTQAPTADYLTQVYLPLLRRMGADVELALHRHGFYPAGGGELTLHIRPATALKPLVLETRGEVRERRARVLLAALPLIVGERELETLLDRLRWPVDAGQIEPLPNDQGPGNTLQATLVAEGLTEQFCTFGERGVPAERVAHQLAGIVNKHLAHGAPVGVQLADQLMLPLALAGGRYVTGPLSGHSLTNLETIGAFLPGRLQQEALEQRCVRIVSEIQTPTQLNSRTSMFT